MSNTNTSANPFKKGIQHLLPAKTPSPPLSDPLKKTSVDTRKVRITTQINKIPQKREEKKKHALT